MPAQSLLRLARAGCAALLAAASAHAAELSGSDLPPIGQVNAALAQSPSVIGARIGIRLEEANRARLDAGAYEFQVRGAVQNRNVAPSELPGATSSENFTEWDLSLERPLRLPNKAAIDREIGGQGVTVAQRAAFGAWHEGARELLRLWFAWVRESAQLSLWREQAQLARDQREVVDKRVAAGDAPRAEQNLAEAAAAQADAALAQAAGRANASRAALAQSYPGIVVPATPSLADPRPLDEPVEFYLQRVLAHNDEIGTAREEARRRELIARRASSDRTPDPTLGLRIANEFGGAEKIAGVYLVVPLPGGARSAAADAAARDAEMARSREAAAVRRMSSEVAAMHASAQGAYAAWLRARDTAEGMRRHAQTTMRAYRLKEAGLAEVVAARRLSVDAQLSAVLAGLEAAESRYRLMIEAHLLWREPTERDD